MNKDNNSIENIPYPDEAALLAEVQSAFPGTFGRTGDQQQQGIALVHRLCAIYAHTLAQYRAGDTQAINETHQYVEQTAFQLSLVANSTNAGLGLVITGLQPRLDAWLRRNIPDDVNG